MISLNSRNDLVESGASGAKIDPSNTDLGAILAPQAPGSLDSRNLTGFRYF